jgi:hypothetical protein
MCPPRCKFVAVSIMAHLSHLLRTPIAVSPPPRNPGYPRSIPLTAHDQTMKYPVDGRARLCSRRCAHTGNCTVTCCPPGSTVGLLPATRGGGPSAGYRVEPGPRRPQRGRVAAYFTCYSARQVAERTSVRRFLRVRQALSRSRRDIGHVVIASSHITVSDQYVAVPCELCRNLSVACWTSAVHV